MTDMWHGIDASDERKVMWPTVPPLGQSVRVYHYGVRLVPLVRTKDAPGWLSIATGYGLFFLALAVIWRVLF